MVILPQFLFHRKQEYQWTKIHKRKYTIGYSVASTTPISEIPNEASASGRQGESTTLQMRVVPRPFFKRSLQMSVFSQAIPRSASMRHDISTDGFQWIFREHSAVRICNHLVCNDNSHSKFVGELLESSQELSQILLSSGEFSSSCVIRTEQGCGRIHNDQCKRSIRKQSACLDQKLHLVFAVECSGVDHIIHHLVAVELETLADLHQTLRAKGSFGVDVESLPSSATVTNGQLADYAQRMT